MRTLFAVLGLTLLTTSVASAQIVRGVVEADGDATPIEAALVRIIDAGGVVRDSAVTDSLGRFLLTARRDGRYLIHVDHLAYTAIARPLELTLGYEVTIELRMAPNAIALEPLIVTSRREVPLQYVGFYSRSRSGMGRFLTREDIERRSPVRTTDLFQVMPRVALMSVGGRFAQIVTMSRSGGGRCAPNVFIDGMPHMSAEDINTLQPEDIDGIEVYTSPALTPAEYQRGSDCGAILFWLRRDGGDRPFTWTRMLIGVGAFLGLVLLAGS